MKRITAVLIALTLAGCASTHTFQASPQAYRAKGQDDQIQITGKVDQKVSGLGSLESSNIIIFFDGQPQIKGALDKHQSGEFVGEAFNGKKTSASCSSEQVSDTWTELKCIVFVDNERAATLTM